MKKPVKIYKDDLVSEVMPSSVRVWLDQGWTLGKTEAGGEDAAALGEGQQAGPTPASVDPLDLSDAGDPAGTAEGDVTGLPELG